MATYSSPDRLKAISILRNSASIQAAKVALPLSQFVAEQAAIGIGALDAALAGPGRRNTALYQAARDRLAADAEYVFEYRQDQVDASFNQELDKLHAGLYRSHQALQLVDPAKLRVLLNDSALPDGAITPELVVDAVHRVQVVSPFSVGFEAYSKGNLATPLVIIGYGSSELMFHASHLIVAYGMRETSPGISNPRSLREHPEEYAHAVAELEVLLRRSESGAAVAEPVTQAADHYGGLVHPIAGHALSFFVLHELGHLLVKSTTPYDEELACDEFAASILGSSDDDRCWLGVAMGAQLLSIALRKSHAEWRSATYPGASYRLSNVTNAMRRAGAWLQAPVDYLLDIPSRVYEQDVFETDTRRLVFFSYAGALLTRWGKRVEPSTVLQLALAVLDYATRLPPVLEHPKLTCWNDESGQRAYVLTLEPYRGLRVAGWMLAEKSPQWEQLAAEAALLLITTVNHDPPPSIKAAGLFLSLARHNRGAARRDRASRDYLERIGAIGEDPRLFPQSTGVAVFYHAQSPGDGDIPVAADPYARRQTGALMAAWQEYSTRTDRESPWYVQRGVKALESWPSH